MTHLRVSSYSGFVLALLAGYANFGKVMNVLADSVVEPAYEEVAGSSDGTTLGFEAVAHCNCLKNTCFVGEEHIGTPDDENRVENVQKLVSWIGECRTRQALPYDLSLFELLSSFLHFLKVRVSFPRKLRNRRV